MIFWYLTGSDCTQVEVLEKGSGFDSDELGLEFWLHHLPAL